jgi:hypothetical protein
MPNTPEDILTTNSRRLLERGLIRMGYMNRRRWHITSRGDSEQPIASFPS